jgi:hypothetical protein
VDVFVSWNGATGVGSWEVRAGPSLGDLRTVGAGPRTGFETRLRCATRESHVQAIARDGGGAQLGASALTPISR